MISLEDVGGIWYVLALFAMVIGLLILAYRKHIFAVFDPLSLFIITQAFSIVLGILKIDYTGYLINFLACNAIFVVAFLFASGNPRNSHLSLLPETTMGLELSVLRSFVMVSSIVLIIANIYLFKNVGVALFAEDPSAAKSENFAGGGIGVVRRMNWGLLYITTLGAFILFVVRNRWYYMVLAVGLMVVILSGGSKGGLVYFISFISLYTLINNFKTSPAAKTLTSLKVGIVGLSVLVAAYVAAAVVGNNAKVVGEVLFIRFLLFGDAILYYYTPETVEYFRHLDFQTFLYDEFNGVLGFLRLVPYERPLGFKMVDYNMMLLESENSTFGPNVPYYVKGYMYFGPWGALFYAALVGVLIGLVRRRLYRLRRISLLSSLVLMHLNLIIFSFAQDSQLCISMLFDTLVLSFPIFLLVLFYKRSLLNAKQTG